MSEKSEEELSMVINILHSPRESFMAIRTKNQILRNQVVFVGFMMMKERLNIYLCCGAGNNTIDKGGKYHMMPNM